MKKYCIDSFQNYRMDDHRELYLSGWFSEENHPFSNVTIHYGHEKITPQIDRFNRQDVEDCYPEINGSQIGFYLKAILPKRSDDLRITFNDTDVLKMNRTETALSTTKNPIVYSFEILQRLQDQFIVSGFARSLDGKPVSVEVLQNNQPYKTKIQPGESPDFKRYFLEGDSVSGFVFSIEGFASVSEFSIRFSSGDHHFTLPLKMKFGPINKRFLNGKLLGIQQIYPLIKTGGLRFVLTSGLGQPPYQIIENKAESLWYRENNPTSAEYEKQRLESRVLNYRPLISVVTAAFNTDPDLIMKMISSIKNQTYDNWELIIADGSDNQKLKQFMEENDFEDQRIRYIYLGNNYGISANTNEALKAAEGEFIAFADHDDELREDALFEIVKVLNQTEADMIYTDEDKIINKNGDLGELSFKPEYSKDYLLSVNYFNHLTVIRRKLIEEAGYLRPEFDGSQDYDLILRMIERIPEDRIRHIPKPLYHWRMIGNSTAVNPDSKRWAFEAGQRALQDYLDRNGISGSVSMGSIPGTYHIEYEMTDFPKISIIIPTKDHTSDLERLLKSIDEKVTYPNYEILLVENNSELEETFEYYKTVLPKHRNVRLLIWEHPFNYSAINNFAARQADGELILMLNNDMEVIDGNFLERMASNAIRPEIGAVGLKLLTEDGKIQHNGVLWGAEGGYHLHMGEDPDGPSYGNLKIVQHNVIAVTGAAIMVNRDKYFEVGGLDEFYQVAYNDVDFCLKLNAAGYNNIVLSQVRMYHFESLSRGLDDHEKNHDRFYRELDHLVDKWRPLLPEGDPYYSKNLSLTRKFYTPRLMVENEDIAVLRQRRKRRDEKRKQNGES